MSASAPDFDRLYEHDSDPWQVATSWYEQRKIAVVGACLGEQTYQHALDPACGTGHLVRAVAARCGTVLACDASAPAVDAALETCADLRNVTVQVRRLPYASEPALHGPVDLLMLSEFLYYFQTPERRATLDSLLPLLAARVEVMTVHWRERPEDGTCGGDDVHLELRRYFTGRGFRHQVAHFDEEFVLDVFTRGHDRYSG